MNKVVSEHKFCRSTLLKLMVDWESWKAPEISSLSKQTTLVQTVFSYLTLSNEIFGSICFAFCYYVKPL